MKHLVLLSIALLVIGLIGCGEDASEPAPAQPQTEPEPTPEPVEAAAEDDELTPEEEAQVEQLIALAQAMAAADDNEAVVRDDNGVAVHVDATEGAFTPNTLTANDGDIIRLAITSTDADHAIELNALGLTYTEVPQGETVIVEMTAKTGTHDLICTKNCGSGSNQKKMSIVVS